MINFALTAYVKAAYFAPKPTAIIGCAMLKVLGFAVVLALASGAAQAQTTTDTAPVEPVIEAPAEVAAIDPNAPLPTNANVVAQCTTMSTDVDIADPEAGICITAAQSYIAALVAAPVSLDAPAVGTSARDAALNALVAEIAQLTQDNICDKRDDELAAAVDAAAAGAEAEETRTTLAEIARTIREVCTDGTTAAIEDGSPADVGLI